MPDLRVRPLTQLDRAAFHALHSQANGLGWCSCVAWWVQSWGGWGQRTSAQNLALREALFDSGELDIFLLFRGAEAIGSCQVGPRDRLTKLTQPYALAPDPTVWAISCVTLAPDARGMGLAHTLVRGAVEVLTDRGVKLVQAFPRAGQGLDAGDVWTGPARVFEAAGFTRVLDDPRRPIYQKELESVCAT